MAMASKTSSLPTTTQTTCRSCWAMAMAPSSLPSTSVPAFSLNQEREGVSMGMGDFNGDGNQDLVVANNNSNDVSILLGNGDGTFQPNVDFGAGTVPNSVAVGDFNGDGRQDLAVANASSNDVSILLGNGDGTFQPTVNFGVGGGPFSVAVGDFNGDGKQDLAVANVFDN